MNFGLVFCVEAVPGGWFSPEAASAWFDPEIEGTVSGTAGAENNTGLYVGISISL